MPETAEKMLTSYRSLKRELVRAQEEIKRIQSVPLVIGQFMEAIDQK
jgi:26S proteasome regulatory subunit T3